MNITASEALHAYAKMINTLDVSHIKPLLDDDFRYTSQWVFSEITSKQAFLDYINPKLEAIANSGTRAYAEMAELKGYGNGVCVVMAQGSKDNLVATVLVEVKGSKIQRLDMCLIPPPEVALRSGEYPA